MAYDGILMHVITNQLKNTIETGRINKIYQISKYELLITIRANRQNYKLLLSAHPMYARVQLTNLDYPTPEQPTMLTMLLRKHLEGSYIESIEQYHLDRILKITMRTFNEIGDLVHFTLYIEVMGKHSNIILTNEEGKILDCLKHITPSMNTQRIIQPGATYVLPPMQNKKDPFKEEEEYCDNYTRVYQGFSPELSREFIYRIDQGETFKELMHKVETSETLYITRDEKKEYFHILPLTHISPESNAYSLADGLDMHYGEIDSKERIKQQTSNLLKYIQNEYNKNNTKLEKLLATLDDSENSDLYRIKGDLLFSYLNLVHKGMKVVEVDNYYDGTKLRIDLDPKLDAKGNAKKYYNKYQKAKNSIEILHEQIELCEKEIEYFDSLITLMDNASYYDALEIKEELENLGYLRKHTRNGIRKKKNKRPSFETYITKDDITIYVGKNNLQNDFLTFKFAGRYDMWFHAKDMPGSHVIVHAQDLDEYTIRLAAKMAAYFSKGKYSSSVPVNYTLVKTLKKPSGGKPGLVLLDNYKTIYIDPDDTFYQELKKG